MIPATISTDTSKIQMSLSLEIAESLKAYSEKHGITVEEAVNCIVQNFLAEDGSVNVEPGRLAILDDDVYDYLESEFKAGLDSVKSESDWISEEEMGEFINSLKSS
ncbi:MAG: hypothetical protein IK043_00755 [Candidatus Methanomethylophilaceae archaeon]|nr:hypothetical protein [Candidatus Methanomethylophilaceae archaeon]